MLNMILGVWPSNFRAAITFYSGVGIEIGPLVISWARPVVLILASTEIGSSFPVYSIRSIRYL